MTSEVGVGVLGRARRILVVEDDSAIRSSACELLEQEGFEVSTSEQGMDALLVLRDGSPLPDLIVLDLCMPVMDGWHFRDEQRTDPLIADIPVVAISADSSPEARAIAADAFLSKPFSATNLLDRIERVLRKREQVWIQDRLGHAQRLAVLGTMTVGIGHEINNALCAVTTNLELARDSCHELERDLATVQQAILPTPARTAVDSLARRLSTLQQSTDDALDGALRIQAIAGGLRSAARLPARGRNVVDLTAVINGALNLASSQVEPRAHVNLEAEPVPPIEGDAGQLTQVMVNLLLNAAHALDASHPKQNCIRVWLHRQAGNGARPERGVAIDVSDNGPGIPLPLQKRIFEPFFTTNTGGAGTGLGLFISRSIMKAHGGDLTVSSELGHGTTFHLELPLAAAAHS